MPVRAPSGFDVELERLPPELRWREWLARVEAVVFAAAEPVTRDLLARLVGRDCPLDLLLDDIRNELRRAPMNSSRSAPATRSAPARATPG